MRLRPKGIIKKLIPKGANISSFYSKLEKAKMAKKAGAATFCLSFNLTWVVRKHKTHILKFV